MADIIVFLEHLESSANGIPFTWARLYPPLTHSSRPWQPGLHVGFFRGVRTIHLFPSRWCRKSIPKSLWWQRIKDLLREVFLQVNFCPTDRCPFLLSMLFLVWSCIEHHLEMTCVCVIIACYPLWECKPAGTATLLGLYNSVTPTWSWPWYTTAITKAVSRLILRVTTFKKFSKDKQLGSKLNIFGDWVTFREVQFLVPVYSMTEECICFPGWVPWCVYLTISDLGIVGQNCRWRLVRKGDPANPHPPSKPEAECLQILLWYSFVWHPCGSKLIVHNIITEICYYHSSENIFTLLKRR